MVYISDLIDSLQRMKDKNGDLPIAKLTLTNRVEYANKIKLYTFTHCNGDEENISHITIDIE